MRKTFLISFYFSSKKAKWPFVVTFLLFYPSNRTISSLTISNRFSEIDSCVQIGLSISRLETFSKWEISSRWRLNHARLIFPPSRVILPGSRRNISEVSLKREPRILQCNFRISSCLCNSTVIPTEFSLYYYQGVVRAYLSMIYLRRIILAISLSLSLLKLFIQRFLHLR